MEKPKKLIREKVSALLKKGEAEIIVDKEALNNLYALKLKEELLEIQNSKHLDIFEFADLLQVVIDFAGQNSFTVDQLMAAVKEKHDKVGGFSNIVLNNLNPKNKSNALYFEGITEFNPMWRKPPAGDLEGSSIDVIVYEINPITKEVNDIDFGFYNFEDEQWCIRGDFSMTLFCWALIPTVDEETRNKELETCTHLGYRD